MNGAFGAQITDIGSSYQPSDSVSLTIQSMSYSAHNSVASVVGTMGTAQVLVLDPVVQQAAAMLALPSYGSGPFLSPRASELYTGVFAAGSTQMPDVSWFASGE